jgi:hypothetical protein
MVETAYWMFPKPADLVIILDHALGAGTHFSSMIEFDTMQRMNAFYPILSISSSLLFACVMLAIAARHLSTTDY